ncbi:MAG TPA: peptide deformylase, partial [Prochlorococcaceae cyanobacterium Fu_MAG_50]|nr:peptide deformylase [Prochlorococcaceae cyanobacterium Fu_MAG_50]
MARSFAQLALAAEKTGSAIAVSKEPLDTPPLEIHRLGDRMLRRSARR